MTISNVLSTNPDTFQWYDSLVNPSNLPQFPQKVPAAMLFSSAERLVVDIMDIQQQKGGSDCRLFAIANALCHGTDPSCIVWKQSEMRKHLHYCITQGQLDLFPHDIIVYYKEGRIKLQHNIPLYCHCRQPDTNEAMIQCGTCKKWYHPKSENKGNIPVNNTTETVCSWCSTVYR